MIRIQNGSVQLSLNYGPSSGLLLRPDSALQHSTSAAAAAATLLGRLLPSSSFTLHLFPYDCTHTKFNEYDSFTLFHPLDETNLRALQYRAAQIDLERQIHLHRRQQSLQQRLDRQYGRDTTGTGLFSRLKRSLSKSRAAPPDELGEIEEAASQTHDGAEHPFRWSDSEDEEEDTGGGDELDSNDLPRHLTFHAPNSEVATYLCNALLWHQDRQHLEESLRICQMQSDATSGDATLKRNMFAWTLVAKSVVGPLLFSSHRLRFYEVVMKQVLARVEQLDIKQVQIKRLQLLELQMPTLHRLETQDDQALDRIRQQFPDDDMSHGNSEKSGLCC